MPSTCTTRAMPFLVAVTAFFAGLGDDRAHAQRPIPESRSTLTGAAVDPTHAALPGVTVALEDLARRVTHRTTTDGQGRFQIMDLPGGDYEAEVAVPGFEVFRERVLVAGPLVEREIVLTLRALEETVTVLAGAPPVSADTVERARPETEPCEPRVDQDTQSPIGGQIRPPRMLTRVPPLFPDHLREADLEGQVRLAARIAADGSVDEVSVLEASHPDFADAAENALRAWTWEETLLNCTPVEVGITVTVRFVSQRP